MYFSVVQFNFACVANLVQFCFVINSLGLVLLYQSLVALI